MTTVRRNLRRSNQILWLMIILSMITLSGLLFSFPVLEISSPRNLIPVNDGDQFIHSFTHSMYQAPVNETFIIENGQLRLLAVMTPSVAVLEYFGLDSQDVRGRNLVFESFTIPVASVGAHIIKIRDTEINLETGEDCPEKIHLKISRINLWEYLLERLSAFLI